MLEKSFQTVVAEPVTKKGPTEGHGQRNERKLNYHVYGKLEPEEVLITGCVRGGTTTIERNESRGYTENGNTRGAVRRQYRESGSGAYTNKRTQQGRGFNDNRERAEEGALQQTGPGE